jgi:hypothetical protein
MERMGIAGLQNRKASTMERALAIQDILDAALERAPDRVKAQFALLIGEDTPPVRDGVDQPFVAQHGVRGIWLL